MIIDAALMCAFIDVESNWNKEAYLSDRNGGSIGLTQIDVPTAQWAGYIGARSNLWLPRTNLSVFAQLIAKLAADLNAHGKFSLRNLAAAYNAGLEHVLQGGTDQPYEDRIVNSYLFWRKALETSSIPPIEDSQSLAAKEQPSP